MNKYTEQNIFMTVSQPLNPLVAFKGHFTDQNVSFPYPLFTLSSEFPTLVSYTEVWKRYTLWAEAPCIGHYREYPTPPPRQTMEWWKAKDNILISVVSYNSIQALSSELVILASPWLERQKHDWALSLGSKLINITFFLSLSDRSRTIW